MGDTVPVAWTPLSILVSSTVQSERKAITGRRVRTTLSYRARRRPPYSSASTFRKIDFALGEVLHLRLAEHYPVPLDLKLSIVERINEAVCNIKLSGETISELY
jgi:hypothetical protein